MKTLKIANLARGCAAWACASLVAGVGYAQTTPSAYTTGYRFDAGRQLVGTISPDPDGTGPLLFAATRRTYDARGLLTKVEIGELASWQAESVAPRDWPGFTVLQVQSSSYDLEGRKSAEASQALVDGTPSSQIHTQFSYDAMDRVVCTAVRMNAAAFGATTNACVLGPLGSNREPDRITRNTYDARNRITRIERAVGTPLQQNYATYEFNGAGPRFITDANGNKTEVTYDGYGRRKRQIFPSKTVAGQVNASDYEEYHYTKLDSLKTLDRRDRQIISYEFDDLNRMEKKDLPGTTTGDVFYGYDLRGLQRYARFGSAAVASPGVETIYDGFGRRTTSTTTMGGVTRSITYQWDREAGRRRITFAGMFAQYTFDGRNRMDQIGLSNIFTGANLLGDIGYDRTGRRGSLAQGNGVVASWGFDGISRLSSLALDVAGTSSDLTLGFGYNPASQVTSRFSSNDAYRFTPSPSNRAYVVNGLNQYTQIGGTTHSYDTRGNLVSDGTRTFIFDVENRLIEVRNGSSSLMILSYDPLGRLFETNAAGQKTQFLYDGDALVAEYNSTPTTPVLLRRYVHGAGDDEPLVWYEGNNTSVPRRLHSNHQGSIIAWTDSAGIPTTYKYGPYGEPQGDVWTGPRFRYTGQIALPEVKLYHYKARVYDPYLGRFLQTDPVGYDDDINLYSYVGNDPGNRTDPDGQIWKLVADFALEVAVQYVTTGKVDLVDAAIETAKGAFDPLKTIKNVQRLGAAAQKTYQTYKRHNARTGETYTGRTSGKGTPEENIKKRMQSADHREKTKDGYGDPVLDKSSSDPDAIRGREQQQIDVEGGAKSDGGTSGNEIPGISDRNKKKEQYMKACDLVFGRKKDC